MVDNYNVINIHFLVINIIEHYSSYYYWLLVFNHPACGLISSIYTAILSIAEHLLPASVPRCTVPNGAALGKCCRDPKRSAEEIGLQMSL